ncbi:hypothetical protein [Shouchella lonarensis]|uniref:Uncharacterized protein n=1 Tax=Shouchella lonarensis TaxID=1464122 RepID=A0A1G6GLV5_9BACI|nr:hypothetical protein [Shouchella lonarensis]SDB82146.1 hypothetical protein SAMN05421737_101149 [Shouchella lonarensis]
MHKVLAILILGMGLIGAILIISVALLFESPIENMLKMVITTSVAFVIFFFLALVFRWRLDRKRE